MKSLSKAYNKGYIYSFFVVLSILIAVVYKYIVFYQNVHLKYTWVPDVLMLFGIVLLMIRKNRLLFTLLLIMSCFKLFGTLTLLDKFDTIFVFSQEVIKTSIVYCAIPILVCYTRTFSFLELKTFFKIFKIAVIIVSFSIFYGVLFNVYMLETYAGKRFGISGLLYPSSFSSYFVIVSILILYYYNKNIEKVNRLYISLLVFSALFIGTKSTYFFLIIFFLVVFIEEKLYKKKLTWYSVLGLLIIFISFQKEIVKTFIDKFDVLVRLYQESDMVTFILSYRNYSFNNAKLFINENWSVVNYLIGGVNRKTLLVEMGLIDIGLSFGIIGTIIYVFIYYKYVFSKIILPLNMMILIGSLAFIILLSGNFFKSITLAYFVSYLFLLISWQKNDTNPKY
jgi:hypothetical protein